MEDISLCPMTCELCHQFFRDHQSDPAVYEDESQYQPYVYTEEAADRFFEEKQVPGRLELVALKDGLPIGHVQLKHIDPENRECEFGWHMQNDTLKGRGYGTRIARLALAYAFETLDVDTVTAFAICRNTRSQHVLEKVGFRFVGETDGMKCYRISRPL